MSSMSSKPTKLTHIFTDLGGVLLTNGWDRALRRRVVAKFEIDQAEMDERHHLTYDTYESGKIDLTTYLNRIIFFRPRNFTEKDVVDFVLGEAKPLQEMIDLVKGVKARHGIKVGVVSNEGKEIAADRVERFRLHEFIDFFVISGFVGMRKPDAGIWRLALDVAQADPGQVAYLEDRGMFAEIAAGLGFQSIWHRDLTATRMALAEMGLD